MSRCRSNRSKQSRGPLLSDHNHQTQPYCLSVIFPSLSSPVLHPWRIRIELAFGIRPRPADTLERVSAKPTVRERAECAQAVKGSAVRSALYDTEVFLAAGVGVVGLVFP